MDPMTPWVYVSGLRLQAFLAVDLSVLGWGVGRGSDVWGLDSGSGCLDVNQMKTVECSMQYGVDGCVAVRVYTATQWLVQLDQICHSLI